MNDGNVIVPFEMPAAVWAEHIHVVGDFNRWDRGSLPVRRTREGNWKIDLELDAGRAYRFRYLIDGDQ
jgi:1,4-alpha-glucan branching enzyme